MTYRAIHQHQHQRVQTYQYSTTPVRLLQRTTRSFDLIDGTLDELACWFFDHGYRPTSRCDRREYARFQSPDQHQLAVLYYTGTVLALGPARMTLATHLARLVVAEGDLFAPAGEVQQ